MRRREFLAGVLASPAALLIPAAAPANPRTIGEHLAAVRGRPSYQKLLGQVYLTRVASRVPVAELLGMSLNDFMNLWAKTCVLPDLLRMKGPRPRPA